MNLFLIFGLAVLTVIAFIILLVCQQRDQEYRAANGLPPKKYHNVSDYDVNTTYTTLRFHK